MLEGMKLSKIQAQKEIKFIDTTGMGKRLRLIVVKLVIIRGGKKRQRRRRRMKTLQQDSNSVLKKLIENSKQL